MATYTKDGITFNSVPYALGTFEGYPVGVIYEYSDDLDAEIDSSQSYNKIINAIDIDWNGAEMGNDTVINTTPDLLNYIKGAYSSGGDSSQSDFNSDEIEALKGLVKKDEENKTYILKLEARIAELENTLNSTLSRIATIETNANKVSGNTITKAKLENLINYGLYTVINDSNIFGSNNATPGKIRTYSAANFVGGSSNYYNNPSNYKEIKVVYTVDGDNGYVVTDINNKLDKTAISYNDVTETLTVDNT